MFLGARSKHLADPNMLKCKFSSRSLSLAVPLPPPPSPLSVSVSVCLCLCLCFPPSPASVSLSADMNKQSEDCGAWPKSCVKTASVTTHNGATTSLSPHSSSASSISLLSQFFSRGFLHAVVPCTADSISPQLAPKTPAISQERFRMRCAGWQRRTLSAFSKR
eukprot:1623599-Rhodomonas_salina.2